MSTGIDEYRGKRIVVRFDGKKCVHSRQCVLGNPDVFIASAKGAWIRPDAATPEAIAAVAHNCPSGAITYERLDGGEQESAPGMNTVRVRENGPLAFHAELRIGNDAVGYRATLCRCGASQRKPYCDFSHTKIGFSSTGEPPSQEGAPIEKRNGPLVIKANRNGCLKVEGPLEIVSGMGRRVARVTEAWLCRFGHSADKPFCDGTHKRIGFTAD